MKMDRCSGRENWGRAGHRATSNRNSRNIKILTHLRRVTSSTISNRHRLRFASFAHCSNLSALSMIYRSAMSLTLALLGMLSLSELALAQKAAVNQPQHKVSSTASDSIPENCLTAKSGSEQISVLLESVKDHPTSGAYNTLGALYAASGQINCAVPAFHAALRIDSTNWEAHYNLALSFLHLGDTAGATTELRAAIHEKPDSAASRFALGTLLHNQKKLASAAAEFDAVLKIDPIFPGATVSLARVLTEQGNSSSAITLLERALAQPSSPQGTDQGDAKQNNQTVPITVALALTYQRAGETDKASETIEKLILTHPDSAEAYLGLGTLKIESQPPDLEGAIAEFRKTLRMDPQNDEARLALGRTLIAQEKFAEAISP